MKNENLEYAIRFTLGFVACAILVIAIGFVCDAMDKGWQPNPPMEIMAPSEPLDIPALFLIFAGAFCFACAVYWWGMVLYNRLFGREQNALIR